jgi:hypothetical protein
MTGYRRDDLTGGQAPGQVLRMLMNLMAPGFDLSR